MIGTITDIQETSMTNYEKHAQRELTLWRASQHRGCRSASDRALAVRRAKAMSRDVLELLDVFAGQGHSGFSGSLALRLFADLADFKPLTPLVGDDSEWQDLGDGLKQNIRCPRVFMRDGAAFDSGGIIWRDANGCCYTDKSSHVPITFPYTPTSETRAAPASESNHRSAR